MKITIGNNLTLTDISLQMKAWFIQNLTFPNPVYEEAIKHKRYTCNINSVIEMFTSIPNGIVIPRGYLELIEKELIPRGGIDITDERVLLEPIDIHSSIELRPYQQPAKRDLLAYPNGLLVAPAGSGKTILGLDVFATLRQKTLWITHTKRLLKQAKDRALATMDLSDEEIGIIGNGKWQTGDKLTIALVQTLVRNTDILPELGREFGLVIVDEAHHVPASIFMKVIGYFYAYYLYALTATPYRRDKLEALMFTAIGPAHAKISRHVVKDAGGTITPTVVVRNIYSLAYENNDFHYAISELVIPNENRSNIIAADVVREAREGNFCIVICTRKVYCEILYDKIFPLWDKTGLANGDQNDKHNHEQVRRLEESEITVLITTFDLLGEGFDVPKLNRGFIALPFRERVRVEQAVGRIQRTCAGKKDAIMYDYVDVNIGILNNQFRSRSFVYEMLGMEVQ